MQDVYSVKPEKDDIEKVEIINIEYDHPKLAHRVLANFTDILIFIFVFILLFLACRGIVQNSSGYRDNDSKLQNLNISSSLYINTDDPKGNREYRFGDEVTTISYFYHHYGDYPTATDQITMKDICRRMDRSINKFIKFLKEDCSAPTASQEAQKAYDKARLEKKGEVPGHEHYFIRNDEGEIIIPVDELSENPFYSWKSYFEDFYRYFVDDTLIDNFYVKYAPNLKTYLKNESNYLLFVELPISFVTSLILVYYVPALFFRRGRKTLGKALYRIALVNKDIFSPSFGKWSARFGLFFMEAALSIVSFGAPFFISFTMMLVTKQKQGFPDYILRLNEVDDSQQKIYYNKIEILADKAKSNKKASDFKLPKTL